MSRGTSLAALVVEVVANGLWQGSAIALLSAALLRWRPRATPAARHAIWTSTLLAILLLPAIETAVQGPAWAPKTATGRLLSDRGRSLDEPAGLATRGRDATDRGEGGALATDPRLPESAVRATLLAISLPNAPWPIALVTGLLLFGTGQILRVAVDVVRLRRLASRCVPVDEERQRLLPGWWAERAAGPRRARLCVSEAVTHPMLLGLTQPTVVVPAAMVSRLSNEELDHVALHELGHARRWDDWTRLGQRIAVALLFFHPAARWVARRMDVEGEKACDAWVVARTGERRAYAASLVRIGELTTAGRRASLAPAALTRKPQLSQRVEALLDAGPCPGPRLSRRLVGIWGSMLVVLVAGGALAPPALSVSRAAPPSPAAEAVAQTDLARQSGAPSSSLTPDERLRADARAAIGRDDAAGEDPDVRRIALSALRGRSGTAIVMDPSTGHVRAIVNQEWAVRRVFHPASLVKLVTAVAALRQGAVDPSRRVDVELPRRRAVDLAGALAYSSTDYFQHVGEQVGLVPFLACAREMGLGQRTGVDLAGEVAGNAPVAETADVASLYGAGAGFEVTPIQLAVMAAAIANGGSVLAPQRTREGAIVPRVRWTIRFSAHARERLIDGMVQAVARGTGVAARDPAWTVAGKTGTWQEEGIGTGLFVSFAPAGAPRFVAVVVTQGRHERGASAAGVAGSIYRLLRAL